MNQTEELDEYSDIRPYNDSEVPVVMNRLMEDPELADTILSIKHPRLSRIAGWALRPLIRRMLHREFDSIRCVRDLQVLIGEQMEKMLDRSGTAFTVSGLENLPDERACLFVSNHRDIAMDPAFVNLALYKHGLDTVRIAIGDNLLTKPFSSDLMRLNKSFIVRRSISGRREKLAALTTLSRYIRHSILLDGSRVWIAQREGRAKDGIDRTETALIKMLSLGKERDQPFAEAMAQLCIVPVAISYMYDPCDLDKARELFQKRSTGEYKKTEHEDLLSLYKGIVGYKGAVHVAFGEPVTRCDDADAIAAEVDRQILGNYRLHPTNLIAWERINGPDTRVAQLKARLTCDWKRCEHQLMERTALEREEVRRIFLDMYANPVDAQLALMAASPS